MVDVVSALIQVLEERLPSDGLGRLYTADDLLAGVLSGQVTKRELDDAIASGGVVARYRGGWSGVPITLDRPNRRSTLHVFGPDTYGLDTESAVQSGALRWLQAQRFDARMEVPDDETVWSRLAESRDLRCLQWDARRAGTACRDLVAQSLDPPGACIEIWEVKGKTAVEGDFYETFGQVFPISDPSVTRGWTNNRVPKHGRVLQWAEYLASHVGPAPDRRVSISMAVLVPDLPPPGSPVGQFYDGPSRYYGEHAATFKNFLVSGSCEGDGTFARLLRHLRDRYALLDRVRHKTPVAFRFLGFQGTGFIRDFATGSPLRLGPSNH